jgi:hypothetical protein
MEGDRLYQLKIPYGILTPMAVSYNIKPAEARPTPFVSYKDQMIRVNDPAAHYQHIVAFHVASHLQIMFRHARYLMQIQTPVYIANPSQSPVMSFP